MKRGMRRTDREITDRAEIDEIIDAAPFMELGMCGDDGWPYVVPLCFGYEDGAIYFHGAMAGKKLDLLQANPRACFQIYIDAAVQPAALACDFEVTYRSVTGFGRVTRITDLDEKNHALEVLMAHYNAPYQKMSPDDNPGRVWVCKLEIEHVTGKRHL